MKFSFGSDPEFMLVKDGDYYSAIGVLSGDSDNRTTIEGHQFYYDNVMAECAVKPVKNKSQLIKNFQQCLKIYAEIVSPLKLHIQASQIYPDDQLKHPEARVVGCSPDSCAYELKMKDPPVSLISDGNLRSCGGHIHLGNSMLSSDDAEPILSIYMLDLFLGIPSLWLDKDETSSIRRKLYGQAGRYRAKDYGIEYRSLGNFWLKSPQCTELIYDICGFVIEFVQSGKAWEFWSFDEDKAYEGDSLADGWQCLNYDFEQLRKAIDTGDKNIASEYLDIVYRYLPISISKRLRKMINQEDTEFYSNWMLN
jgi:hypothetical protein